QKVILLLGGNQGDVLRHFNECVLQVQKSIGPVYAVSGIYKTKAWGPVPQPDFLNMALGIRTVFPPQLLLKKLLALEKKFGRVRDVKYGHRTLDIDILFYGHRVINTEYLRVPHPEIQNRRFALVACNDIASSLIHPVLGRSIRELLASCKDPLEVKLWKHQ